MIEPLSVKDEGLSTSKSSWKSRHPMIIPLTIVAVIVIVVMAIAIGAGWIGKTGSPHVFITDFAAEISDFPDCTATFSYILHNDGTAKGYVDIDYLDNGLAVAHDFYVVDAGGVKYAEYSIFHVDCVAQHEYDVRIAAVS